MSFASYSYLIFLALTLSLYSIVKPSMRRPLLLIFSYGFYATWNSVFCILLGASSIVNWGLGRVLQNRKNVFVLWGGILVNLLALAYFKYLAFLTANFLSFIGIFGFESSLFLSASKWSVMLPLGISFFTFEGISYLVDVYAGDDAANSPVDYALYVAFWPHLLAGPILRFTDMSGQILRPADISFEGISAGWKRILIGLFKKVILADTVAPFVESVFANGASPNFVDVVAGTIAFGLQIYFDFSGYSDIAIGSSRAFGFRFPENFNWPYAALGMQQFWSKWHMTLSQWIKDYVFGPLAFAKPKSYLWIGVSLLVSMALCGLWHGANWTYLAWGAWHGAFLIVFRGPKDRHKESTMPSIFYWIATVLVVNSGWLIFRSDSLSHAFDFSMAVLTIKGGLRPAILRENAVAVISAIAVATYSVNFLKMANWKTPAWFSTFMNQPVARALVYVAATCAMIIFDREAASFVYFQF